VALQTQRVPQAHRERPSVLSLARSGHGSTSTRGTRRTCGKPGNENHQGSHKGSHQEEGSGKNDEEESRNERGQKMRVAIYARVSTNLQSTESQLLDLRRYVSDRGWNIYREYCDEVTGTKDSRPALNQLMNDARKRRLDIVLVWRFDRFARSTRHLINSLEEFRNLGIDFVSFQENIDTSSPLGAAIFTIISAVAQLERDIISERVKAGLRRAKKNGKQLGRPRGCTIDTQRAQELRQQNLTMEAIAAQMGTSPATVWRALNGGA